MPAKVLADRDSKREMHVNGRPQRQFLWFPWVCDGGSIGCRGCHLQAARYHGDMTSPVAVIVNEASGVGQRGELLAQVLRESGIEAELHVTSKGSDISRLASELYLSGQRTLVAVAPQWARCHPRRLPTRSRGLRLRREAYPS